MPPPPTWPTGVGIGLLPLEALLVPLELPAGAPLLPLELPAGAPPLPAAIDPPPPPPAEPPVPLVLELDVAPLLAVAADPPLRVELRVRR